MTDTTREDPLNFGKPVRVGLVGAGYAARGFVLQCLRGSGPKIAYIVNRTPERARRMLSDFGANKESIRVTDSLDELFADTSIEAVVEATGDVEYGALVAQKTISYGKHIILVNAELDGTLGPILKSYADTAGVIYTQANGDQPAIIMNLIREAQQLGLTPVVGGNIKTFFDRYRTPETQKEWAVNNGQSLILATSAIDGTKLAFEMATVANAAGFCVDIRGMHGFGMDNIDDATQAFTGVLQHKHGIVDYILGAKPPFGVFVIATTTDPIRREYLKQYKMGNGPFYLLYRPYHLCTLEAPASVFDAVNAHKATIAPLGVYCEVVAVAKKDLFSGETLDGIGGFSVYGVLDNRDTVKREKLLPIGLSRGCILKRPVKKDMPVTYDDVNVPAGREVDRLYQKQAQKFL